MTVITMWISTPDDAEDNIIVITNGDLAAQEAERPTDLCYFPEAEPQLQEVVPEKIPAIRIDDSESV